MLTGTGQPTGPLDFEQKGLRVAKHRLVELEPGVVFFDFLGRLQVVVSDDSLAPDWLCIALVDRRLDVGEAFDTDIDTPKLDRLFSRPDYIFN